MLKVNDLFISADGTYPGICTERRTPNLIRVKWYKWGYDSKDYYSDTEHEENVAKLLATPADIQKKFWALPPEYDPTIITTGEKMAQFKTLASAYADAEHDRNEGIGTNEAVDAALAGLVKFYLEGRE